MMDNGKTINHTVTVFILAKIVLKLASFFFFVHLFEFNSVTNIVKVSYLKAHEKRSFNEVLIQIFITRDVQSILKNALL